jgi:single-strand DNA-binding protein
MAKKYDVVAIVGSYEKDGETKKRYKNVGMVNENDKGNLSLLLTHPITIDDEGKVVQWLGLYEPQNKDSNEIPY